MIRLKWENTNSAEEYDKVLAEKSRNSQDLDRWVLISSKLLSGSLLDIGCLDSPLGNLPECVGIDISKETIKYLKEKRPKGTWRVMSCYDIKYPDNSFNNVVMGELIEHLEEPHKAIKEALRVLKPGGILAISTPLEEAREPGAVDKEHHLWSFSKQDIKDMCWPYKVEFKIMRSKYFPKYEYRFPTLIAWATKN